MTIHHHTTSLASLAFGAPGPLQLLDGPVLERCLILAGLDDVMDRLLQAGLVQREWLTRAR